jgi:hypothetical protein
MLRTFREHMYALLLAAEGVSTYYHIESKTYSLTYTCEWNRRGHRCNRVCGGFVVFRSCRRCRINRRSPRLAPRISGAAHCSTAYPKDCIPGTNAFRHRSSYASFWPARWKWQVSVVSSPSEPIVTTYVVIKQPGISTTVSWVLVTPESQGSSTPLSRLMTPHSSGSIRFQMTMGRPSPLE